MPHVVNHQHLIDEVIDSIDVLTLIRINEKANGKSEKLDRMAGSARDLIKRNLVLLMCPFETSEVPTLAKSRKKR